ncbi:MAG: SEC-C domain-containing protein [Deltaproteobacteria bacterium]|nr:SEC-C domain-containing protein [Deltaproteobacteria bacterium]
MQLARELAGSEDLKGLWQRLLAKAEAVSREEFLAVAALQPLLKKRLLVSHLRIADDLAEARELLKKVQRPTAAQAKHLRAFWQSAWFMGDQLVLGCLDGRRGLTQELIRVLSAEGYLAWGVFRQGEQVLALRALWAMGRWGKPLLEGLTAMFSKASTLLSWMYSACGLLMIALRYPQYRRRITDLVTASRPPDILLDHLGKAAGAFAKILVKYRTSPEDLTDLSLQWWRREYVRFQDKVHSPAHLRFATAAEVPEDLALTWGANQEADLMNDPAAPVALLMWLPWLARVEAQELYLPAEVAAVWRTPWRPERALAWVQRYEDHYGPRQPVTVAAVPGRNAPCTCGSGKKYKRCCGAAA